jgi:hypothetical protein
MNVFNYYNSLMCVRICIYIYIVFASFQLPPWLHIIISLRITVQCKKASNYLLGFTIEME